LGIRLVLSNRQWERIAPHSIGGERTRGSSGRDNRLFVEAVLWLVRTGGGPWRDFPEDFGPWNSVFRRFSRWSRKGVWWRILEALSDDPDFAYLIVHYHSPRPPTRFGGEKGGLKIRPSAVPAVA
jgi:putative transposase